MRALLPALADLSAHALSEASGLVPIRRPDGSIRKWVERAEVEALRDAGWLLDDSVVRDSTRAPTRHFCGADEPPRARSGEAVVRRQAAELLARLRPRPRPRSQPAAGGERSPFTSPRPSAG
jgi:hypothetical protein